MKLWSSIKHKVYKDQFNDMWVLDELCRPAIDLRNKCYTNSYRLIKRKFFFFYVLENEWISTYSLLRPNL
jgi:hypothetical protein